MKWDMKTAGAIAVIVRMKKTWILNNGDLRFFITSLVAVHCITRNRDFVQCVEGI